MNKEDENPNQTGPFIVNFADNPMRQRIYKMFLAGGRYSVVQLSEILKIPDPRSHIRYIRNAGIAISDYWVKTEFSRYKVYFLAGTGKTNYSI